MCRRVCCTCGAGATPGASDAFNKQQHVPARTLSICRVHEYGTVHARLLRFVARLHSSHAPPSPPTPPCSLVAPPPPPPLPLARHTHHAHASHFTPSAPTAPALLLVSRSPPHTHTLLTCSLVRPGSALSARTMSRCTTGSGSRASSRRPASGGSGGDAACGRARGCGRESSWSAAVSCACLCTVCVVRRPMVSCACGPWPYTRTEERHEACGAEGGLAGLCQHTCSHTHWQAQRARRP